MRLTKYLGVIFVYVSLFLVLISIFISFQWGQTNIAASNSFEEVCWRSMNISYFFEIAQVFAVAGVVFLFASFKTKNAKKMRYISGIGVGLLALYFGYCYLFMFPETDGIELHKLNSFDKTVKTIEYATEPLNEAK